MVIDIDLAGATPSVELVNPDDRKSFPVAAWGRGPQPLAAAASAGVGRLLPSGDAMVDIDAVGNEKSCPPRRFGRNPGQVNDYKAV